MTTHSIFLEMLRYRGDQELLHYWMAIEKATSSDLESAYIKAWSIWRRLGSSDRQELASALSGFLHRSGRMLQIDEWGRSLAERVGRFALRCARQKSGPFSVEAARFMSELALIMIADQEAIDLAQGALEIYRNNFGDAHVKTADALDLVSGVAQELEDFHLMKRCNDESQKIRRELLGQSATQMLYCNYLAASAERALGFKRKSINILQRMLSEANRSYGKVSVETAELSKSLAKCFVELGNYKSAIKHLDNSLTIQIKIFGNRTYKTFGTREELAKTLHLAGEFRRAETLYRDQIDSYRLIFGDQREGFLLGDIHLGLGQALIEQGKAKEGGKSLKAGVAFNEPKNAFGEDNPDGLKSEIEQHINLLVYVGELLADKEIFRESEWYLRRALRLAERLYGPRSSGIFVALEPLARFVSVTGNLVSKKRILRRALKIAQLENDVKRHEDLTP